MMPIALDIETSGADFVKCGIWQIGTIDLNNLQHYFLEEARIDDEDEITEEALKVSGKTEEELRNSNKQSQKKLLENFFRWINGRSIKNFLCQNPSFDRGFLEVKARKYNLEIPFHYRSFDLHTIAQIKYYDLYGKFLIKEDHSDMGLSNILNLCGIEDKRKAHNALEDVKLMCECFSRLVYGKSLFKEFEKFPIPEVLKKWNQ